MGNVIVPERYREIVVDPLTKTREMLFVGAIMNVVSQLTELYKDRDVHSLALSAREHIAKVAHDSTKELTSEDKEACTRALMEVLAIAGKLDINVALGALRLFHADKQARDVAITGADSNTTSEK